MEPRCSVLSLELQSGHIMNLFSVRALSGDQRVA